MSKIMWNKYKLTIDQTLKIKSKLPSDWQEQVENLTFFKKIFMLLT